MAAAVGRAKSVIWKYADRGLLPYWRGSHCTYIDPADLLVIKEIDWNNPPTELAEAVRRSLISRLVKALSGQNWRAGRPYDLHPRAKKPQPARYRFKVGGERIVLKPGDLIQVIKSLPGKRYLLARLGYVQQIRRNKGRGGSVVRAEIWQMQSDPLRVEIPLNAIAKVMDGQEFAKI